MRKQKTPTPRPAKPTESAFCFSEEGQWLGSLALNAGRAMDYVVVFVERNRSISANTSGKSSNGSPCRAEVVVRP
jgi:hypothetical protein